MPTDSSAIVERRGIAPEAIIATLRTALDGAGTLPARDAVNVRPTDWHAIERVMRESADEITRLRAALAAETARGDKIAAQLDFYRRNATNEE